MRELSARHHRLGFGLSLRRGEVMGWGGGAQSTMAFSPMNYKWLPFVAGGGRNLLRIG